MGSLDSLVVVPPDNDVHGDIMETSTKQFDKLFNDRLTIPFKLTKAALPTLQKSNGFLDIIVVVQGRHPSHFKVAGDGSGAFWDSKVPDEALNQLQSMIPLGRLGKPSDAASLVQFLLSPRASK
ncbi:hypothetical protein ANCCEY_06486 [Ancylostoma ceylanicum]|uniref:Uncharacterized protein n=1 Tax=Ancylostoma ceylanicum TaxID=53326 RepID=A0A0D6LTA1_9BILA|nr:hypothetical protein ANCCEY_06486 [Ancylostoma ceylanicum]